MTILDEKEPTVSLKLILAIVSLVTVAAFASLYFFGSTQSASASREAAPASSQALPAPEASTSANL